MIVLAISLLVAFSMLPVLGHLAAGSHRLERKANIDAAADDRTEC